MNKRHTVTITLLTVKARKIKERKIAADTRNCQPDEISVFIAKDKLPDVWSIFLSSLGHQGSVSGNNLQTVVTDHGIALISFSRTLEIIFTITISRDMKVKAKISETIVSIRDLLGFQHKLQRWSQLEAIINRVKHAVPSPKMERDALISKLKRWADDDTTRFLLEQLELTSAPPRSRRYSPEMLLHSLRLYIASRSGYKQLRYILSLPDPKTLKKNIGPLHLTGGAAECKQLVEECFSTLSPAQRNCAVFYDEVYIKPSLRYRGGHVIGSSADQPGVLATTVLAIMVKPLLGGPAFIARLVPVRALKQNFLYEQLDSIVDIVQECGGTVRAFVSDNHFVNKQLYSFMSRHTEQSYLGNTSNCTGIHLLYDSTHLLKNVRNNWLNEITQTLRLDDVASGEKWTAKFGDIRDVWAAEADDVVRMTNLTYTACYPTVLERQNFQHVAAVFHEKTVAALLMKGKTETANVVKFFTRLWKILNIKNTTAHVTLNDPDRRPFYTVEDENVKTLHQMAQTIRQFPGGKGRARK